MNHNIYDALFQSNGFSGKHKILFQKHTGQLQPNPTSGFNHNREIGSKCFFQSLQRFSCTRGSWSSVPAVIGQRRVHPGQIASYFGYQHEMHALKIDKKKKNKRCK